MFKMTAAFTFDKNRILTPRIILAVCFTAAMKNINNTHYVLKHFDTLALFLSSCLILQMTLGQKKHRR